MYLDHNSDTVAYPVQNVYTDNYFINHKTATLSV